MNLVTKISTIVAWSKDHCVDFSTKVLEQPPILSAGKTASPVNEHYTATLGLSLTLSGKGNLKAAFWIPAYGSQEAWSITLDGDGIGKLGIKADLYNEHDLMDFLDKETTHLLLAA